MAKKNNASVGANEKLLHAARTESHQLLEEFNTSFNGYSPEMAEEVRDEFGKNKITHRQNETMLKRLFSSFVNPFTVVLFVLALISVVTKDFVAVAIVLTMVFSSGILHFFQESRSSNAAQKLKAMITTTTSVRRAEAGKIEIPLEEVVLGDIINLAAGDMIPADVRILSSKDLFVSESSLTGESSPVEKVGEKLKFTHTNALELNNLAFMGSNVVSGSATCVAVAIGDDTYFGQIAKTLVRKKVVTSFEKGVNSVSWLLIRFMLIAVPIVLLINGFTKGSWMQALLFGLSVAVGLTPEMLPMIVTTGLARGAVRLAKKKTVIKNLNSIQNFGAMDVLCTDKTGTITRDEIILESYLDIHGNSDLRILRHAFLNSYFQTGMKNLMDVAILNHDKDVGMEELVARYTKVDEIPFDFSRRRMSVVIKDKQAKTQLITKGAVEEMLSICTYAEYHGVVPLTDDIKKEILKTVEDLNAKGMRVLAVAQKTNPSVEGLFSVKDESDMVLIGYLAFLDPPKETSAAAIRALNKYGVAVKILTGDNTAVTKCISAQVGLDIKKVLEGTDVEGMTDDELSIAVEETTIFAKLSPQQKARIIAILRKNGHVVGYMGDGINDAAAMRESDVGISVDTAVDIAKESADIILLEKDLMVLEKGIIEGRKTFANIIKYIKMTASSNFGNILSILIASVFLPFLPMLPLQILMLNLIYDISCISIPWDNVDSEYLTLPKKWESSSIGKFMIFLGPVSSIFDALMFVLLYFVVCPAAFAGQGYGALGTADKAAFASIFQTGWFVMSLFTQTLVIHLMRTKKLPFIKSRASLAVILFGLIALAVGTIIPFTPLGAALGLSKLAPVYFVYLVVVVVLYILLTTLVKNLYIKKYKELL